MATRKGICPGNTISGAGNTIKNDAFSLGSPIQNDLGSLGNDSYGNGVFSGIGSDANNLKSTMNYNSGANEIVWDVYAKCSNP